MIREVKKETKTVESRVVKTEINKAGQKKTQKRPSIFTPHYAHDPKVNGIPSCQV